MEANSKSKHRFREYVNVVKVTMSPNRNTEQELATLLKSAVSMPDAVFQTNGEWSRFVGRTSEVFLKQRQASERRGWKKNRITSKLKR